MIYILNCIRPVWDKVEKRRDFRISKSKFHTDGNSVHDVLSVASNCVRAREIITLPI